MSLKVVAYTDAAGRGGAEISFGHLLTHLPSEVEVTVAGTSPAIVRWLANRRLGVDVRLLPANDIGAFATHLATFLRLRPHVVHVNRYVPWCAATGILAALSTPGARVVTVDQLPLRTVDAVRLWRTRALTLRVDARVAVGEASARQLEDFYALGRDSVHSIPNGVPDVPPPPRRRDENRPLVVGAVGRLDAMKGFDVLLRAVSRLSDVRVVIIGEGDERSGLEQLAAEQGISNRVSLTGWDDNPRNRFPGFDVFALPSRSEGFPLTLVEAMFAGLPIVASRVGSVAEAVIDGETGLLVEPGDIEGLTKALTRLRDDPPLRKELGARARLAAVQKHAAEGMATTYLDLWKEVVARPRVPRLRVRELKA